MDKKILFTSVRRTERNRELHMRNMSPKSMLAMIRRETKREAMERFRQQSSMLETIGGQIEFHTQRICVAATFRREGTQGWRFTNYNGLVLLSVGQLTGAEETELVKRLARMHPSTYAAFVGSSGRSVKIIVRVCDTKGKLPQTEGEAQTFHRQAYNAVLCSYEGMVGYPITRVDPTLEQNFVRTFDAKPYFNAEAVPMRIDCDIDLTLVPTEENPLLHRPLERLAPGEESYAELERRFLAIITRLALKKKLDFDSQKPETLLTTVARECCEAGFPLEEAILHALAHFGQHIREEDLRTIFECAYQQMNLRFGSRDPYNRTQRTALLLREFMRQRYVLRHNVIQDCEEFRLNVTWDTRFRPLDDRMVGLMVEEARLRGIDVWDKDILRYVRSAATPQFNPVEDFLQSVRGLWDGTDRIALLADTVPTRNPRWHEWFRRWFLSMVAQWMGVMGQYANSVAPLLIGRQGWRKSTFCRQLLPDELQFGYTDQLNLYSRQEVDRTICQYLLVNLDEFDQLTRRSQDGYLKNLLQRADIRTRQPYKTRVAQMRRYASFIGTSNQHDLLTDPTGGRRYLCIELTGPIDVASRPDYLQLYAQAVQLVEQGERYWFDDQDVEQIMANNRSFMNLGTAEQTFHDLFAPAYPEDEGAQWLTTTQLLEEMRRHLGSRATLSAVSFGRYLIGLPGMQWKRSSQGTKYCVKPAL